MNYHQNRFAFEMELYAASYIYNFQETLLAKHEFLIEY